MAAIIQDAITEQNFELIRTRIGVILTEELANQATLNSDPNLDATVWEERFTPMENSELPAVNVAYQGADIDEYNPLSDRFDYRFYIDVTTKAIANQATTGDLKSQQKLQRLVGVIRGILRNTQYKTLGFPAGFIATSHISIIEIANPYDKDGNFIGMARVIFIVRAIENNGTVLPIEASGYDTSVTINETDKGYKFVLNN